MDLLIPEDTTKLETLNTKEFISALLNEHYPSFFRKLNEIDALLQALEPEAEKGLLCSIHRKMNDELDEIYRKEKLVLFPFLMQLEEAGKVSDSCKPFKNVKQHYTALVAALVQFRQIAAQMLEDEPAFPLQQADLLVEAFQSGLIQVQKCKEKYLLNKFKNCSNGCKSLTYDHGNLN